MNTYEFEEQIAGVPIKSWTRGVLFEETAREQVRKLTRMPFLFRHVAIMPDVHAGIGSTVGSVIATKGAIIPAAVGVDIGCGMCALKTSLRAEDLPDNLSAMRSAIEAAVPHGRTDDGGANDRGAWGNVPDSVAASWKGLQPGYDAILAKFQKVRGKTGKTVEQLGTLGTGNHFIEVCLDETGAVWFMLHSGSRGVGNRIGTTFINLAKEDMKVWMVNLPDQDLAYLPEGTQHFGDYWQALNWAQKFAAENRRLMMEAVVSAVRMQISKPFELEGEAINCHHNYASHEKHFGENVYVTRKGAVDASLGRLGIIPGSMGAKSFIVRGKGERESFHSCSHGAGRVMSRTQAKKTFSVADHEAATAGVECRKDESVLDETPAAYKSIDAVMAAQEDLIEIVTTLKQVLCVKG